MPSTASRSSRSRPVVGLLGLAAVGAAVAALVAACASREDTAGGSFRTARVEGLTGAATSTAPEGPSAQAGAVGTTGAATEALDGTDWDNAVYRYVCGLDAVRVVGGVGETSAGPDGRYGVEVVDVAVGDIGADGRAEAAVLVDCLGGDTWMPQVIVVDADGVERSAEGTTAVVPLSGGSPAPGARPVSVGIDGGVLDVDLERPGGPQRVTLRWAPHVLVGGELPVVPSSVVTGVLSELADGIAVLSTAPGEGYRFPMEADLQVLDPGSGAPVAVSELVGRSVVVGFGADGSVGSVVAAPDGGA